jgi:mediator of RNA polymerase II transcription subunit 6
MDRKHWSFVDERWLNTFGLGPLNVMQYFAMSPFYDPRSNNHALMTQNLDLSALTRMQGLEFVLDDRPEYGPDVFVIKKQNRISPDAVRVLEVYFIVHGVIYQSPSLMEVVASRMHKANVYLNRSLEILMREHIYTTQWGHSLVVSESPSIGEERSEGKSVTQSPKPEMVRREMPPWQVVLGDIGTYVDQRLQQNLSVKIPSDMEITV